MYVCVQHNRFASLVARRMQPLLLAAASEAFRAFPNRVVVG